MSSAAATTTGQFYRGLSADIVDVPFVPNPWHPTRPGPYPLLDWRRSVWVFLLCEKLQQYFDDEWPEATPSLQEKDGHDVEVEPKRRRIEQAADSAAGNSGSERRGSENTAVLPGTNLSPGRDSSSHARHHFPGSSEVAGKWWRACDATIFDRPGKWGIHNDPFLNGEFLRSSWEGVEHAGELARFCERWMSTADISDRYLREKGWLLLLGKLLKSLAPSERWVEICDGDGEPLCEDVSQLLDFEHHDYRFVVCTMPGEPLVDLMGRAIAEARSGSVPLRDSVWSDRLQALYLLEGFRFAPARLYFQFEQNRDELGHGIFNSICLVLEAGTLPAGFFDSAYHMLLITDIFGRQFFSAGHRREIRRLLKNRNFVLQAAHLNGYCVLNLLWNNRETGGAPPSFLDDPGIVLAACSGRAFGAVPVLSYVSERLRNDMRIVVQAVKQNGAALEFASAQLRDDRDVVEVAVNQNAKALNFASARLKSDGDLVEAAIKALHAQQVFRFRRRSAFAFPFGMTNRWEDQWSSQRLIAAVVRDFAKRFASDDQLEGVLHDLFPGGETNANRAGAASSSVSSADRAQGSGSSGAGRDPHERTKKT